MRTRLQYLKAQLQIGSGGVRMVGIWGIGGGGKTTLASSLYMEIRGNFHSSCFVENIKEESSKCGMNILQGKILSTVFDKEFKVESVDIGKITIQVVLRSKKVLIVLDDVDDCKQLEALAGSRDWFGDGSRIIITTRDEHLLTTHMVDEVSHVSLLSDEEAILLFDRCAYNKNNLVEDYKSLSQDVISYAGGLPLAIKVVGKFLNDKNKDEWISTLNRLKVIPEMEIVEMLKISYDGLKPIEKELFLDIACFFRGKEKDEAMPMLEACGFHPGIGVKVLIQKDLITINSDGRFDMHDLIQDMGHHIVRGEHPNNPEKHSRLWRREDIEYMCSENATLKNDITEAIVCADCPSNFHKLVSNANKLRLLSVSYFDVRDIEGPNFLSNELRYIYWSPYPASTFFPESFLPRKPVVLKLAHIWQKELWRGYKCLPCLKELYLIHALELITTPDFGGLPCLQKLTLQSCHKLEEINPSLGNHSSLVYVNVTNCEKLRKFPTIVQMGKLKILEIKMCHALRKFPKIKANMDSLVNLSLEYVGIEALPSSVGDYCTNLNSLKLKKCSQLKSIECNFHALKHLHKCIIVGFGEPLNLPKNLFNENICLQEFHYCFTRTSFIPHLPCFLRLLNLSDCGLKDGEIPCDIGELSNLQELNLSWNKFSRFNFSLLQLTRLKLLDLSFCGRLVELPKLPTSIAVLKADCCESLEVVGDIYRNCKWLCQVSIMKWRSVTGGDRLLQSMLQGNAIENGCMSLHLKGLEIPNGFITPLLMKGYRYRLELPENWYNHFSGFLICAAMRKCNNFYRNYISMKHKKGGSTTGIDCQQEVYWEESVDDGETLVGYVSFAYLKDTTLWWDPTSTNVEFSINNDGYGIDYCSGLGVSLVSRRSQKETITTYSSSESSNDYTCGFSIQHDSKFHLIGEIKSKYKEMDNDLLT